MHTSKTILVALTLALTIGCAPAYHSYSDCCVPYCYCAPPPLPYVHYAECGCYSCTQSKDVADQLVPVEDATEDSASPAR